jgi:hypothetical protein
MMRIMASAKVNGRDLGRSMSVTAASAMDGSDPDRGEKTLATALEEWFPGPCLRAPFPRIAHSFPIDLADENDPQLLEVQSPVDLPLGSHEHECPSHRVCVAPRP